ncbi:MAG: hypothetical protein QXP68_04285 [Thermosphaera sp.]
MDYGSIVLQVLLSAGIVALLIIIGYIAGRIVYYLFVKTFKRLGIDDWFMKFGMGKAIRRTGLFPGEFFGSIGSWMVYIAFSLLGFYMGFLNMEFTDGAELAKTMLTVYLYGLVKALIVIIIGFILVDSFVSYVYRSSELRAELRFITPVAEYLRILFYLVVVIFALEQGGIDVSILTTLITPIVWGLAFAMIAIIVIQLVADIMSSHRKQTLTES